MVANLTIGKKGYDEIEKLMVSIRDKAHGLRQRYLDGIAEDAAAFDGVIRAVRLPKDTPDRAAKVQQAFRMRPCRPLNWARTSSSSSSWRNKSSATATPGSSRTASLPP